MKQMRTQTELADTVEQWKATYAECFPHRNPEGMELDDKLIALAVMLRRELKERDTAVVNRLALAAGKYDPE